MDVGLSIIIPNYNGSETLTECLQAACAAADLDTEIIVVDDASSDNSVEIITRYPCRLIRLPVHCGAAGARNIGAAHSRGEFLFFTDADCLIQRDTLARVRRHLTNTDVIGGTYTCLPFDNRFFSHFQSLYIRYFESKNSSQPDYLATHAFGIRASVFTASGGFSASTGPILEDVEFSHRLKRQNIELKLDTHIQVQHVFNYTFTGSVRNAFRKARYWTAYSLSNQDLLADSGTASRELKLNGLIHFACFCLLAFGLLGLPYAFGIILCLLLINLYTSRGLFVYFFTKLAPVTAMASLMYYFLIYPAPVCSGALVALIEHFGKSMRKERQQSCIPS